LTCLLCFNSFLSSDVTVWHYAASTVRSVVNNELEGTENEVVVACSSWFPDVCLGGLKKTMKNLSGKPLRDSNWVLSKHRYSDTVSLTSALDWGVRGQHHASADLPPGKRPFIPYMGGWVAPGPVWTGAQNLAPYQSSISVPYQSDS